MKRPESVLFALFTAAAVSCGGGSPAYEPVAGSPGPVLVVERFLQAANRSDLATMMELFGTAEHTIEELDGRSKAERRMHVLASLLRHDDYAIVGQQALPGRMRTATELQVRLLKGDTAIVVPHIVVRKRTGGWIIERIDIEKLTTG